MWIDNEFEQLDYKNCQKHVALDAIVNFGMIFVLESVGVLILQNGVDQIKVLIPAKDEKHKHE